jgi:hypothetical protein
VSDQTSRLSEKITLMLPSSTATAVEACTVGEVKCQEAQEKHLPFAKVGPIKALTFPFELYPHLYNYCTQSVHCVS